MALTEFYCKFCETTQLLRNIRGRATCGSKACGGKRRRELTRISQGKARELKKNESKKVKKPKAKDGVKDEDSFEIIILSPVSTQGYEAENKSIYETDHQLSDYKDETAVYLFGKNYKIDWGETAKFKKGIVTKKVTISNTKCFLVLKDFMVEKRDEKDYYNESA